MADLLLAPWINRNGEMTEPVYLPIASEEARRRLLRMAGMLGSPNTEMAELRAEVAALRDAVGRLQSRMDKDQTNDGR